MNTRKRSIARARANRLLMCGASVGAIAVITASSASAQDVAPIEQVTVTGTLIKGINPVGTNLITVDAATIQASGALTTNQVLEQIPQISTAFNTNVTVPTGANVGGVRPTIRNLTAQGGGTPTLILFDGHNAIGVGGLETAPDPGVLPAGVLQRVDVVPDGGSALYGANATTGVINFITRTSFEGLQADFSAGVADGYEAYDSNLMAGKDWGSGSAYVAYEHKTNTFLMDKNRSYTAQNLVGIGGRDARATACPLPNITVGANNYAEIARPANTPGALIANVAGPFPGLNSITNAGSLNRCDTNQNISLTPKETADSMFVSLQQHIADGVDFSTKILWSSRFDASLASSLTASGTIDATNPFFQPINGETQQTVQFDFSPYYGKNNYTNNSLTQVAQVTPQLTVALPFGDWESKVMLNWGRSITDGFTRSVNTSALSTALRQQTINGVLSPNLVSDITVGNAVDPYNVALTNPTVLNEILNFGNLGIAIQHQEQAQFSADGTLFTLPGGAVKAVVGAKYDWEDFDATWGIAAPIGQYGGAPVAGGQYTVGKIHRTTSSGFGEVEAPLVSADNNIPLVHSFTLDISGRIDSYSDFGQTDNYKLGFTYEPFDDLKIRGNMGTSYDAPSLADELAPDGRLQYTPQRTSPNTVVPPGTSAADALRPSILIPGGNPNLQPELSHTWSVGADFHPESYFGMDFTGLDLSITGWHVGIANQIGLAPFGSVQLFQVPAYAKFYLINPTPAQLAAFGYNTFVGFPGPNIASAYAPGVNPPFIAYDARRNNLGNAQLDGIDFAGSYSTDVSFGTISAGVNGTVSLNNSTAVPGGVYTSLQANGRPLYAISGNVGLTDGALGVRVSVNYSPSYLQNPAAQAVTLYHQLRVGSFAPVNAAFNYDLNGLYSWTSFASVSLTVNNIFDESPPQILSGGTANGSTLGRYVLIGLHKKF